MTKAEQTRLLTWRFKLLQRAGESSRRVHLPPLRDQYVDQLRAQGSPNSVLDHTHARGREDRGRSSFQLAPETGAGLLASRLCRRANARRFQPVAAYARSESPFAKQQLCVDGCGNECD